MVRKTRRDRATDIYYKISPLYLAAIVMLNFLLVYLNLATLEDVRENTELGIVNQELGLNISEQNQHMLEQIIGVQQGLNETIRHLNESS